MIPLKILMVGLAWQLGLIVLVMAAMLTLAFVFMHKIRIPVTWPWVLGYSTIITVISELIYKGSKLIDESVPIHVEVLLPAFVLGCIMAYPERKTKNKLKSGHHSGDTNHGHEFINTLTEKRVTTLIAAIFMVLVGLSMPLILSGDKETKEGVMAETFETTMHAAGVPESEKAASRIGADQQIGRITSTQPAMSWSLIAFHVLLITLISNLGKMFPALCFRREAHWRERLAVAIGMWPRGEVGAGVLVISMSYGIGGPIVTIAMLSLSFNLLLTGLFIYMVKRLTVALPGYQVIASSDRSS